MNFVAKGVANGLMGGFIHLCDILVHSWQPSPGGGEVVPPAGGGGSEAVPPAG